MPPYAERCLTNAIQSGKALAFPPPMKLLLALLIGDAQPEQCPSRAGAVYGKAQGLVETPFCGLGESLAQHALSKKLAHGQEARESHLAIEGPEHEQG